MRICDRCKINKLKTTLLDKKDSTEYDLCEGCLDGFYDFLAEKPEDGQKARKRRKVKDAKE